MKKRVIIVHGWGGNPESNWFPWLKRELSSKGYEVEVPEMPDTDYPKIEAWVGKLAEVVGKLDNNTILVGHSMGCQAIMRYLENAVGQTEAAILVAPFFILTNIPEDDQPIGKVWEETPVDDSKIKSHAKKIISIFSDNDPFVPMDNVSLFEERLSSQAIVFSNKGHMNSDAGMTEFPQVLDLILSLDSYDPGKA